MRVRRDAKQGRNERPDRIEEILWFSLAQGPSCNSDETDVLKSQTASSVFASVTLRIMRQGAFLTEHTKWGLLLRRGVNFT